MTLAASDHDDPTVMMTDKDAATAVSLSSPEDPSNTSTVPVSFRQTLIDEARKEDIGILHRRPERICLQVCRSDASVPYGFSLIGKEEDVVVIHRVHSTGLFSIVNPALEQLEHKTLLQEGDVLESINDFDCQAKDVEEIETYLQQLVGVVTIVVTTQHDSSSTEIEAGGLSQVVVYKPKDASDDVELPLAVGAVELDQNKQGLLQIQRVAPSCNLPLLAEGDLVVAMNSSFCISLNPLDGQLYLDAKLATSDMFSLTTISCTAAQRRWRKIRKSAVAVGGGTMVGVGAVIMVTPLHPIGHALAIGGVGVLGSEFEAPKRAMKSMKESVTSSIARRRRLHEMESMDDKQTSPNSRDEHAEKRPNTMQSMRRSLSSVMSRRRRLNSMEGTNNNNNNELAAISTDNEVGQVNGEA